MNKVIKSIIGVLGILCIVLIYFVYYQLPRSTYKLEKPPQLLTSIVMPGENLKWINDICKLHDKDFYVERVLKRVEDKREFVLSITNIRDPNSPTLVSLKKGECRTSTLSQMIPFGQPAGKYSLITRVFVKSNKYSTDKFEYIVGPFVIK